MSHTSSHTSSHTLSHCPICNSPVFLKFSVPCDYRKPNNSPDYQVHWCPQCDYGMVENRPSKEEIPGFYVLDDYYTHQENSDQDSLEKISFIDRLRIHLSYRLDRGEELSPEEVKPWLAVERPKICEIGCGNGQNLPKFQVAGYEVFGVEPDSAARKVAQEITPNIFAGTAEELPEEIAQEKYDVVLMSHVLEHCLDINSAVANVRRILKDGGIYIVEIPNCNALGFKTYEGNWPWSDIPRHLNFFSRSSLTKILEKHDFTVKSAKYRGFCRQFSNNWLNDEREIWTAFAQHNHQQNKKPNFRLRSWKLLLRSLFASADTKYDSIRLVGIKQPEQLGRSLEAAASGAVGLPTAIEQLEQLPATLKA